MARFFRRLNGGHVLTAILMFTPNGSETCDGFDNDCNGVVDDNPSDIATYYRDADGDGFGSETEFELACPADKSDGYIEEKVRDGLVVLMIGS